MALSATPPPGAPAQAPSFPDAAGAALRCRVERGLWHGTGLVAIAALHAPGVALLGLALAGSRCCGTVLPWSLAGAGVVLATTLALHAWLRRAVVPSLRRHLLAPLRDRLERRVAAALTAREARIHGWSDGAIGLERGRLVLCTRDTRYQAVVLRPLDLWSVSLGSHRSPPSFDLCYRDPVWRRPRTVRIAFERPAEARAWARAIVEPGHPEAAGHYGAVHYGAILCGAVPPGPARQRASHHASQASNQVSNQATGQATGHRASPLSREVPHGRS